MSDSKKYWFKRRRYGYGWIPVTVQGWLLVIGTATVVFSAAMFLLPAKPASPSIVGLVTFLLILVSMIFILVGVSLATSPPPRWRWGKKPGDNPDEDF